MTWCAAGAVTGACASVVDTVDTAASGFGGQIGFYAWYAGSSLTLVVGLLFLVLGAWCSGVLWACGRLPGRAGRWLSAALIGLPLAAFVGWVPTSWIAEHYKKLEPLGKAIAVSVYPSALVLGTLLGYGGLRLAHAYRTADPRLPRGHHVRLGLAFALAALSYVADRRVLVGLYEDFHYGLTGAFLGALGLFVLLCGKSVANHRPSLGLLARRLVRRSVVAGALATVLAAFMVVEWVSPDVFGPSTSVVFGKLVSTSRAWSDFDRDGLSHLFGGSDCAPFDPRAHPGLFDMPGNGRDEDCTGSDATWPEPDRKVSYPVPNLDGFNLILITVDALRADHVGAYGYKRHPTTPNIDRFANRGVRFAEAFSPTPKTHRTLPSLVTGLYPSNVPRSHRANPRRGRSGKRYPIANDARPIAEILQRHGYQTFAAHGVPLRGIGLDRGFDEYLRTREATTVATEFLERRRSSGKAAQPFFMWLHYYSPHHTYEKRPGFDFGDDDIDRYDSEIAFDDQQIGLLLERVEALGLLDRTVVMLTADHGEEFRDHGGTQHRFTLYRELTNVPLLMAVPGLEPGVVQTPVELVDIVPTVCELLRLGDSCAGLDGESLLKAVANRRDPKRGAYCELHSKGETPLAGALHAGRYRLIYDYKLDRAELYDTTLDRAEQHNIAGAHLDLVRELRDRMATRPIHRQGQLIASYLKSRDSVVLARALPMLRHERLLELALKYIAGDFRPEHVRHLKKLRKRLPPSHPQAPIVDDLLRRVARTPPR